MGAYDHILKKEKPKQPTQKPKEVSDAAVAASSVVKGLAGIPDMFINAAPNLIGLGLAGSGFVSNEIADAVGRDNTLGRYFAKVNELANTGLNNFEYAPSITNKSARAVLPIQDPTNPKQRVIDWAVQSATGAVLTPAQSVKNFATNAAKFGTFGGLGGVVAEETGSPIAGIAASIAAPVMLNAGANLASRINQPLTAGGRENIVGQRLVNIVQDPQAASVALKNAPKPTVKGSQATSGQVLAQQTGDKNLLRAEDVVRQKIGIADDINARYGANEAARQAEIMRLGGGGTAQDAVTIARNKLAENAARLEAQKARLMQSQQVRGQQSIQQQQTALTNLGTQTSADDAAQRLAAVADPILQQKQRTISDAFDNVDPFGEVKAMRIPMQKIEGVLQENYGGLSLAQDSKVRQAIKLINEAAAQNKAAKDIPELAIVRPEVPPLPKFNPKEVNPQIDDMLTAIAKYGGLNREYAIGLGIDPKMLNQRAAGGLVPFPKNGGLGGDDMAMRLAQDGYPVGALGAEDVWQFQEALDNAMRGYKVLTPQGHELQMARQQAQKDLELFNENLRLNPDLLGSTMTYKQMQTIQSRIGDLQREAVKSGAAKDVKTLTQLKHLIRGSMDDEVRRGVVPADIATSYKKAIGLKADFESRYGRGAVADLRMRGYERSSQNLATLPKKIVNTREGLESFKRSFGSEKEARAALSDYIGTNFRTQVLNIGNGGLKSGWQEKAFKFIKDNKLALDEFGDLSKQISAAILKSKKTENLKLTFNDELDSLMKKYASIESKQLESGGKIFNNLKDPDKVIDAFFSSSMRQNDAKFIAELASENKTFNRALRGAISEKIVKLPDNQVIKFLEDKKNIALIESIYGKNTASRLDKVLQDAKRDSMGKGLGSGSQTFGRGQIDKLMNQNIYALDALGGTLGGVVGSLLGNPFLGVLGGASVAHKTKQITMALDEQMAKAFLNSDEAARLIDKKLASGNYLKNAKNTASKYVIPASQNEDKK
jgi:hypothetical protein